MNPDPEILLKYQQQIGRTIKKLEDIYIKDLWIMFPNDLANNMKEARSHVDQAVTQLFVVWRELQKLLTGELK